MAYPALSFKKLNTADFVTISRLVAAPVVVVTTLLQLKTITGYIIATALFTDLLDGFLVRRSKSVSTYGAMLDSVADASIFLASVFSVVWFFSNFVIANGAEIAIVFGVYIFQIIFALVRYGRITTFHKYSAKIVSVPIGLFIITSFYVGPILWLFHIVCIMGLLVEAEEIALICTLAHPRDNVKGIYWVLKEQERI